MLNKEASLLYIINSDPSVSCVCISTLAFMDDTTLISLTIDGITSMLNLANEFYKMNNTKINFTKAELITNRVPSDPELPASFQPSSYHFNLCNNSFDITSLHPSDSFRFLGVWFSIKQNPLFVKK